MIPISTIYNSVVYIIIYSYIINMFKINGKTVYSGYPIDNLLMSEFHKLANQLIYVEFTPEII